MPPLIDVLVPNLMTADLIIAGIIEPLRDHWNKQLLLSIVDDGSPEHDLAQLDRYATFIHQLRIHPTTLGPAHTFNSCLDLSTSPIAFLCNSDVIIPRIDQLYKLAGLLTSLPPPAIIGTAEGPRFFDQEARPYTLAPPKGGNEPCLQDYVSACAMMWRKQDLTSTLRFSTRYENGYYEDADFCFALRSRGWRTYYVTSSISHIGHQAMLRLQTSQPKPPNRLTMFTARDRNRTIFIDTWGDFLHPETQDVNLAIANYHRTQKRLQEHASKCSQP